MDSSVAPSTATVPVTTEPTYFSLTQHDLIRICQHATVVAVAWFAIIIIQSLSHANFGAYTPLFLTLSSTLLETAKRYIN